MHADQKTISGPRHWWLCFHFGSALLARSLFMNFSIDPLPPPNGWILCLSDVWIYPFMNRTEISCCAMNWIRLFCFASLSLHSSLWTGEGFYWIWVCVCALQLICSFGICAYWIWAMVVIGKQKWVFRKCSSAMAVKPWLIFRGRGRM